MLIKPEKRLLLALTSFCVGAAGLLAGAQAARADVTPRSPWYECDRLQDNDKIECYGLAKHHYFDHNAVGECDTFENSPDTLNCMRAVADHDFSLVAVNVCDKSQNSGTATDCLRTIADHSFEQAAANVCKEITDDGWTNRCLAAIADKHYEPREVTRCDAFRTADDATHCFEVMGYRRHHHHDHDRDDDSRSTASLAATGADSALALLTPAEGAEKASTEDSFDAKSVGQDSAGAAGRTQQAPASSGRMAI